MIRPFGEQSLLVEVAGWRDAQALAASLATDPLPGVEAAVPALASVLVELEADAMGRRDELRAGLLQRLAAPASVTTPRTRIVPVIYGGEHGPDLDAVAALCGLAPGEYARRHASTELRVLFCGFAPGFAYLGELPTELRVARLGTPRTRTPAGSVAVAGGMSGIYPAELPGGWRVIGRTPLALFEPDRDPPAYLAPGDTVRFQPVSAEARSAAPRPADDW